jgi:membrane protein YdbS with pleckstrin-like domain
MARPFVLQKNSMRFEGLHEKLLPRRLFLWRLARWTALAGAVVLGSLAIGICGYHYLDSLPWVDSLLNASMILGGMGPVDPMKTDAAKIFASIYALYSGLALIAVVAVVGLLLAPVIHRLLHKFHIADE